MVGEPKKLGQITFRLKPELHEELLNLAKYLSLDQSAVVNLLIQEALPALMGQARYVLERLDEARKALRAVAPDLGEPLTKTLVDLARDTPEERRIAGLVTYLLVHRDELPPGWTVDRAVQEALQALRVEDERQQIREEVERQAAESLKGQGRPKTEDRSDQ
jgi:hypothetical protein